MIDAHHHIWLQKDLPWLLGPERPRIFGQYATIKRDYLLDEYKADVAASGIAKSVYVQANLAPNWFEDEVAWVQTIADTQGLIAGIVGYADFTGEDVSHQLSRLKKYPLMRGIRQQFHWHENLNYRFAKDPDLCVVPAVQRNIAILADYGWTFDLQIFPGQMAGAAKLAKACPAVTFILQHAGMKEDLTPESNRTWADGMKRLADCPNVVTKLSGFGTFLHRNNPEFIARMVTDTEKMFGADRCMFGSNFPIEKLWTSYGALFQAFRDATRDLSKKKQAAIFNETAARIYRL